MLASGETISAASVTASVYSGVDPLPSGILVGAATISGNVVRQYLQAGVLGVIYTLICSATTSLGNKFELMAFLAISQDAV